jgi:hypothetical protein
MLPRFQITLKNYRCFSDDNPARFTVGTGFTAFVGPNNSGKSTALRFFYEFRQLFNLLAIRDIPRSQASPSRSLWTGQQSQFANFPAPIRDHAEVFHNGNDRPIGIEIAILDQVDEDEIDTIDISLGRPGMPDQLQMSLSATVRRGGSTQPLQGTHDQEFALMRDGKWLKSDTATVWADVRRIAQLASDLSRGIYVGPFRNAIHTGTNTSYYDLQIGQAFIESWRQFKTGSSVANNLAARHLTDEIRRTFGFDTLEINAAASGDTLQVFVDDQSYVLGVSGGAG